MSKQTETEADTGCSLQRMVRRRDYQIWLKHSVMWSGWRSMVFMSSATRNEAEAEAKKAVRYYEGSTAWKVTPACNHKFIDSKHCLKCGWVPPSNDRDERPGE